MFTFRCNSARLWFCGSLLNPFTRSDCPVILHSINGIIRKNQSSLPQLLRHVLTDQSWRGFAFLGDVFVLKSRCSCKALILPARPSNRPLLPTLRTTLCGLSNIPMFRCRHNPMFRRPAGTNYLAAVLQIPNRIVSWLFNIPLNLQQDVSLNPVA